MPLHCKIKCFISLLFLTGCMLFIDTSDANSSVDSTIMAKEPCVKALILIAEGTEEIEFTVVADVLRRAGVNVCVAGLDGKGCVKCSRDVKICPDVALSDAKNDEYDIIILPGGAGGTKRLVESQEVKELLQKQEKNDKWIGAICAASTALKAHGIGKGKTVTSYPSVKDQIMKDGEYKYSEDKSVVDGKLITSRGVGTAIHFALAIIENLVGKSVRDKLAQDLLFE